MNALTIARRDLASYLQGYTAYIVIASLLLGNGLLFHASALGSDQARYSHEVLEGFFYVCWGFGVATAVFLTMRSLAEEYARGTDQLLRASVVSDGQVILGKWLAALGMVAIYAALTLHLPLLVFVHGKVSIGHLLVGYTGVLLGGGVAASVGVFCSALFRNQIAAGIVGGLIAIYMAFVSWMLALVVDPPFSTVVAYTALFNEHFVPLMRGRLTTSSVIYQISVSLMFLSLSTQILRMRRWE